MSELEQELAEIEARAEKATPGPCEKWLDDEGHWHIRFLSVPRGFHGGCYGYLTYASETDVDFDMAARTDIPRLIQIARGWRAIMAEAEQKWAQILGTQHSQLDRAVKALQSINRVGHETELRDAKDLWPGTCYGAEIARQALAEIEAMGKGGK